MSDPGSWQRQLPRLPGVVVRLAVAALQLLFTSQAHAGQFAVHPTRLELSAAHPSGALVIRNEESSALSFQVKGVRWTQDEHGQEHYADAPDLVYFPRLLTLAAGQSAVIRVGLRQRATDDPETTYRVFIEELAPVASAAEPGARIRVLMRFGAPVFARPKQVRHQLVLTDFSLEKGLARWSVRNEGNAHDVFQSMTLRGIDTAGQEIFRQDVADRYLLAGVTRRFQLPVPRDACERLVRLSLAIKTHPSEINRELEVGARLCH